jgi:hypothetical protein
MRVGNKHDHGIHTGSIADYATRMTMKMAAMKWTMTTGISAMATIYGWTTERRCAMMARKEAVRVARKLLEEHEGACSHIGIVAIRQLLDAIYGGPPNGRQEQLMRNMPPRILDAQDAQRVVDTRTQRANDVKTVQHKYKNNCTCHVCANIWSKENIAALDKEIQQTIQKKQATVDAIVKNRRKQ